MSEKEIKPAIELGTSPSPFQGEGRGEGQHPRNLKLVGLARHLRKRLTDVESTLWYHLRGRRFEGIKFRRQYPVGRYIVDFICVGKQLIIELDGGQHALNPQSDHIRDAWLTAQGYRILRFWNNDVIENLDGVLITIQSALSNPHPNPLPKRERGQEEVDPRIDFERREV